MEIIATVIVLLAVVTALAEVTDKIMITLSDPSCDSGYWYRVDSRVTPH